MVLRAHDGAAGWLRRATGPRLVVDRAPEVRTTTAHLGPAKCSRGRSSASERSKIAPVIFAVNRVSFVRSCIGGIDFGRPVATEEGCQCLIDEFGIGGSSVEPASVVEEGTVNGRTNPSASHATIMPRSCRMGNPLRMFSRPAAPARSDRSLFVSSGNFGGPPGASRANSCLNGWRHGLVDEASRANRRSAHSC